MSNLKNLEYLTKEERQQYLSELTNSQKATIEKYKRYKINSALLTSVNQKGVYWQLIKQEVYPLYDIHNPMASPLVCTCGKHVKYLFTCKASDDGHIQKFGKNHLEQEADIPPKVISQVNKINHTIDRGTDYLLSSYHQRMRFPIDKWNYIQDNELTQEINPKKMEMLQEFRKNDLPLYPEDEAILDNLVNEDKAEKLRQARQEQLAIEKIEQFQKKINPDPINSGEDELPKIQAFFEQFLNEHPDIYKNLEADGISKQDKLAWQIVIYYTLNKDNISQNGLITLPFDTREQALGLLDNNSAVKEKLNEEDPYILPKLAFLHFSKTFVKQLLKGNVIHANENGELVYS